METFTCARRRSRSKLGRTSTRLRAIADTIRERSLACYSYPATVMPPQDQVETLFVPKARATSIAERATTGLPPDLLNRVSSRLQILCWLYAFTFFMAAFSPALIIPSQRQMMLAHGWNWAPGVISIVDAIAVALAVRMIPLRPGTVMLFGLIFEVISSYG